MWLAGSFWMYFSGSAEELILLVFSGFGQWKGRVT